MPVEIVVRREDDDVVLVSGVEACRTVVSDGVRMLGGTIAVGPASGPRNDRFGCDRFGCDH